MSKSITTIILVKNDADVIQTCLETLSWSSKIIAVNNGSSDDSVKILKKYGVEVIDFISSSFAELRNHPLRYVKTDWVLYIDPDERVSKKLADEILQVVEKNDRNSFSFLRKNVCYGKNFKHGGWEKDEVPRLFRVSSFKGWRGQIHESPILMAPSTLLKNRLIHHTHRNTTDGLRKTIAWTRIEAELLANSGVKPVTFFTLIRKGLMEFYRRAILSGGYKDGFEGLMEALVQSYNKVLIYIQVWEFQQKPALAEKYENLDKKILEDWNKSKNS